MIMAWGITVRRRYGQENVAKSRRKRTYTKVSCVPGFKSKAQAQAATVWVTLQQPEAEFDLLWHRSVLIASLCCVSNTMNACLVLFI